MEETCISIWSRDMKTGTCTKYEQLIHRTPCQNGITVGYVLFTVFKKQPFKVIGIFNEMK